jgi:hypothetical protein
MVSEAASAPGEALMVSEAASAHGDGMDTAPEHAPSLDEARALLQAADQARVAEAQRLIQQALAETGCVLVPEITISGERISATIRIVPRAS